MILNTFTVLINKINSIDKSLRIAHWNANRLRSHEEEIKLPSNQNSIDVLLERETYLINKLHFSIPR